MGSFERWVSQHQLQALRETSSANVDKHQNATLPPFSTDVIDLSFDEDDEEPVKREASPPGGGSVPGSTMSPSGRRQQQRSLTRKTDSPLPETLKARTPATYAAEKYPPVAKTHPTLVMNPAAGGGAIELRCPYCKANMNKHGFDFLDSINGFSSHLRLTHQFSVPPGAIFSHSRTFELCSYRAVPQDVVDAIQRGDLRAYVVEKLYQKP